MQDIRLQKLKISLTDAIEKWISDESCESNWDGLDTYIGDGAAALMADSAFNILLAHKDISEFYRNQNMMKEE